MTRGGIALSLALAIDSCNAFKPVVPPPQEVIVRVKSDPDAVLSGARLLYREAVRAQTDASGRATLTLQGRDGDVYDIFVQCPEGYKSPAKPLQVRIQRLGQRTAVPEYDVSCPPEHRTVVVAVRAAGGPDLPVVHLGREVARTDSSGATSAVFEVKPHEKLTFSLMTGGGKCETLVPENPSWAFEVPDRDELFVLDVKLEKKGRPCRRPVWRPSVPRRIP